MSMNLLDSISGVFNNDIVRKAASLLGESESGISKAVSAGIPSMLSGIMSSSTSDGGANLLNLSTQAANSGILNNLSGAFSSNDQSNLLNSGNNLLSGLFGNKTGGLTNVISNFAGIRSSSAKSILAVIAPIVLSFIGRQASNNNLSASGILNWLTGQRSQITNALPAGLNLSGVFDSSVHKVTDTVYENTYPAKKASNSWLLPVLLLLAAIIVIWLFARSCNKNTTSVSSGDVTTTVAPVPDVSTTTEPVRELLKVSLPGGIIIDAYKGGIEDRLVAFLNDPNSKAGKDVWFDFDNLNFETGSARITAESQVQVNNISAILKAYPNAKIKIGGYTDVTGDATANMKLSQERADAVLAAIKATGSNAAQLQGAEGYGSQFAKAAADAPDSEKRKDRRIAIGVREK